MGGSDLTPPHKSPIFIVERSNLHFFTQRHGGSLNIVKAVIFMDFNFSIGIFIKALSIDFVEQFFQYSFWQIIKFNNFLALFQNGIVNFPLGNPWIFAWSATYWGSNSRSSSFNDCCVCLWRKECPILSDNSIFSVPIMLMLEAMIQLRGPSAYIELHICK